MKTWTAPLAALTALTSLLLAVAGPALAQHGGASAALPASAAAPEATQFDFLLGVWELEVTPKVSGLAAMVHGTPKIVGSWKAWRAFDGHGISDELRLVDASGNPVGLNHAQRIFDAKSKQWLVQTLDVYRARFGSATAKWQGQQMNQSGSGTNNEGRALLTRTRFHDIGAERFRVQQDRSLDNGATWDEATLVILARRVAKVAPR